MPPRITITPGAARALALLMLTACATAAPPRITQLTPEKGFSGRIVQVSGSGLAGGTVRFDGKPVRTLGSGAPLVFTVPYDAATGSHLVSVSTSKGVSSDATFVVSATFLPAATPVITDLEVGYYSVGPTGSQDDMELVVFGQSFDTNCRIILDGVELEKTFIPGIPVGDLTGLLGGGATLPNIDPLLYDNLVAVILRKQDGLLPALGSTHTVAVRNVVTNQTTAALTLHVPDRRVMVELDKMDGLDWLPSAFERNSDVTTLRRMYTSAGILLDWRFDEGALADPFAGTPQAGQPFSDADLLSFEAASRNKQQGGYLFGQEWYMHLVMIPKFWDMSIGGRLIDEKTRQASAIFFDNLQQVGGEQVRLRAAAHEIGHALGLMHCEGDAKWATNTTGQWKLYTPGRSLMNPVGALDPSWVYQFSASAKTHLSSHPLGEVAPGAGRQPANDPQRQEGTCSY